MKKVTVTLSILFCFAVITKYSVANSNNLHIPRNATTSEEDSIQKYISDHKLNAIKTSSGLYYVIESQGSGKKVIAGQKVTVNYTGSLLNGNIFDSSTQPKFEHVEPIEVVVGQGMVIKGWEEGLTLFNEGGKGKLIIPSSLAYGDRSIGDGLIPAFSPLVFDIQVMKVQKSKPNKKSDGDKTKSGC